jgi:citrate synthase
MAEWLSAREAIDRLGVRPQTLYANVSRGRIEARGDKDDPRKSLYSAADVDRLRQRKARGRKAAHVAEDAIAWGEPVLSSAITTVREGRLYYRGHDAVELARTFSLESVARLLRGGDGTTLKPRPAMAFPAAATARERAFLALAAWASDPPARGRSPLALAAEAAGLLDGFADAVAGEFGEGPIHERLAAAWDLGEGGPEAVRMSLVLLADHELNASTFAARVTASTGASLPACALAGLSALSGPLHGGMAARVEAFIEEAARMGAEGAVRARLAQGLRLPGFGHQLYPGGDPRARALIAAIAPPPLFEAVRAAGERLTGEVVNVDFALTALVTRLGLPADAAFLLFAVARCAGWMAHALEQVRTGQLIRPRARYIGPAPIVQAP